MLHKVIAFTCMGTPPAPIVLENKRYTDINGETTVHNKTISLSPGTILEGITFNNCYFVGETKRAQTRITVPPYHTEKQTVTACLTSPEGTPISPTQYPAISFNGKRIPAEKFHSHQGALQLSPEITRINNHTQERECEPTVVTVNTISLVHFNSCRLNGCTFADKMESCTFTRTTIQASASENGLPKELTSCTFNQSPITQSNTPKQHNLTFRTCSFNTQDLSLANPNTTYEACTFTRTALHPQTKQACSGSHALYDCKLKESTIDSPHIALSITDCSAETLNLQIIGKLQVQSGTFGALTLNGCTLSGSGINTRVGQVKFKKTDFHNGTIQLNPTPQNPTIELSIEGQTSFTGTQFIGLHSSTIFQKFDGKFNIKLQKTPARRTSGRHTFNFRRFFTNPTQVLPGGHESPSAQFLEAPRQYQRQSVFQKLNCCTTRPNHEDEVPPTPRKELTFEIASSTSV